MKTIRLFLAAASMLASGVCFANVPGGGNGTGPDVSVRDEGESIVLDNGIVAIRINKTDASLRSFTYEGMNLLEGGHGGGRFYWSWNTPAFGGPRGTAALSVDPASNRGDYAEVKIHCPWSGKSNEAAMDVDVYYSLKRGAHGYYATATLRHPASYPFVNIGEWRSNTYISPMFDWLSVDELRQRKMPTKADMDASVPVKDAPKEVTLLTSGDYAGQFECKYSYSVDLGDVNVWGWSSTGRRVGIWMTVPSHEYYNGGPRKRELTAHMNHALLNMLNGSHYSIGMQLILNAGVDFKKTYGPFFVYANSYQGAETESVPKVAEWLWRDAQAQARAERSAWPYTWFKHDGYAQASERGTVSGMLKVNDAGNPASTGADAWIGLAPDDHGTDFQHQGRTYQFWVKTGADGSFNIPNVLPGVYNLLAFGAGNIGTFKKENIEVRAGAAINLGAVQWTPPRVAATVWEIGIPDRDTQEFNNGAFNYSQWATFAAGRAEGAAGRGLTYTVGKSDWRKDWNYAQFDHAPWTIKFSLENKPPKGAPASLYVALASSQSTLKVTVNGTEVGRYKTPLPAHAPVRLGSHGPFSETRFTIPSGLLKKGANSIVIMQVIGNGKSGTTQYDYLRLEADGTRLSVP
ncbi:rhamnogalacturonan endolyase [Ereboglobus sp. PH5-10]|uniref:polysaccharide lyase family protein n=1 Tax=Ereboglobus sp. PH5-10 TaxID=2940629 RepID=UPI00240625F4|nr:polysaccharide lyase family protein [Ereboglobus sp. PH5-10]MDF9827041.1 rhamnogalacturonan endolyase [Ereboglobus sp. PH5-10]